MKKFLLAGLLFMTSLARAFAGYVEPAPDAHTFEVSVNSCGWTCSVIDENAKTVSISLVWMPKNQYGVEEGNMLVPSAVFDESSSEVYEVVQIGPTRLEPNYDRIYIPATVQVISDWAFTSAIYTHVNSFEIEKGNIPLDLGHITISTWEESVKSIEIGRSISGGGFYYPEDGYVEIAHVKINDSVSEISTRLFDGNLFIKEVEFENWSNWYTNTKISCLEANPYRSGETEIYAGGYKITTAEIPVNATEIGDFKNAGLKFEGELILPTTLKKIGAYAFQNQKDLFYVEFPDGMEEIGAHAFEGCDALTINSLPETVSSIGEYAFAKCNAIPSIILPENLTYLGAGAFSEMANLQKAVLFSGLTAVPEDLCRDCRKLETVYLPKKASTIGNRAFMDTSIEEIILPEMLEVIGDQAFCHSRNSYSYGISTLSKINFPSSLKEIGREAFSNQDLRSLQFKEGLEKIGEMAFDWNDNISNVSFPSTLKEIKAGAFSPWNSSSVIGRVLLPSSLTILEHDAFGFEIGEMTVGDGVSNLTIGSLGKPSILTIGSAIKSIENGAIDFANLRVLRMKPSTPPSLASAFDLTEQQIDKITFIVPKGAKDTYERNPRWNIFNILEEGESDVVVYCDGTTPITEEIRVQSGIMPSMVTGLTVTGTLSESDWRLIRENMVSLINLDLSSISNTEIPKDGLSNMSLLCTVKLPAKLKKIGDSAFSGCALMDTSFLPDSVEEIGNFAFSCCMMLSIDSLPESLETLGWNTFYRCNSLRQITAGSNLKEIGADAFNSSNSLEYVDLSVSQISKLSNGVFTSCSSLNTVSLPESLTEIEDGAFYNTSLEAINIPQTVQTIGSQAFFGTKLRTVTIPEGIKVLESGVFSSCNRLISVNLPKNLTLIHDLPSSVMGISCPAVDAPEAISGAFSGLSARRCSLTVPRQSYRSYLNAPQWGMFANLVNSLDVEIAPDVEVTVIDEQEYQTICEEEALKEEAESPVVDENGVAPKRVAARRAARADYITTGRNYMSVFNGATLGSPKTSKGTRIFLNLLPEAKLAGVYYNNVDITSQVVDGSFVLPENAIGSLRIATDYSNSIAEINASSSFEISPDAYVEVFDATGRKVAAGVRSEVESALAPGLYIFKSAEKSEKHLVK